MLGKLIKNEIKMSAHMMMNIYVAAAVTIGIMLIAYAIDISWLSAMATIALFLIALIALIITFVGVIANFYKTLYGQQGYLSFTLPVTSGQLLAAKAIVAFLWMIVSYAVSIGIMIWIYDYVTSLIGENNLNMIKTIISMFRSMPGAKAIKGYLVLLVLAVFVQLAFLISELFFSITFANTRIMQKLGAAGPIVVFFAIFIIAPDLQLPADELCAHHRFARNRRTCVLVRHGNVYKGSFVRRDGSYLPVPGFNRSVLRNRLADEPQGQHQIKNVRRQRMELPDRCPLFLTERGVELGSSAKKHKKVKSTTL